MKNIQETVPTATMSKYFCARDWGVRWVLWRKAVPTMRKRPLARDFHIYLRNVLVCKQQADLKL